MIKPSEPRVEFCYVDHSVPINHPYSIDHMNAHLRTEQCKEDDMTNKKTVRVGTDDFHLEGVIRVKSKRGYARSEVAKITRTMTLEVLRALPRLPYVQADELMAVVK